MVTSKLAIVYEYDQDPHYGWLCNLWILAPRNAFDMHALELNEGWVRRYIQSFVGGGGVKILILA